MKTWTYEWAVRNLLAQLLMPMITGVLVEKMALYSKLNIKTSALKAV